MSKAGSFFRELNSKDGSEKEKDSRPLWFKSTTKLEIRHFYVVVVQWWQRNVQTRVMRVQSCCFANQTLELFWSFRRCRRRWYLSPLSESFKNYHFQKEAKCKTFLVEMRFIWSGFHNPFRFCWLNLGQNRPKNKLVGENAVTEIHGSCSLRVMGSWFYQ